MVLNRMEPALAVSSMSSGSSPRANGAGKFIGISASVRGPMVSIVAFAACVPSWMAWIRCTGSAICVCNGVIMALTRLSTSES